MSSGVGSLVFAFFWAASRISLSCAIASSRAAIDFSRPTKSGTTMCGNTMMSRRGRRGSTRCFRAAGLPLSFLLKNIGILSAAGEGKPYCRRCPGGVRPRRLSQLPGFLLEDHQRLVAAGDDLFVDVHFLDAAARRDVVHRVEHRVLEDGAETARPGIALERLAR